MFGRSARHVEPTLAVTAPAADSRNSAALVEAIAQIEAGKYLSVPQGECEIGRALFKLARKLHGEAVTETKRFVDVSIDVSEAICSTAEMIREASEVSRSTETIAASIEEMATSVQEISRTTQAAADEARATQEISAEGERAAEQAVATMAEIAEAVESAGGRVEALNQASAQIGDIINQIEAIAKQTNLLALNATIEAARAGEAGKGFAVVAGEVKNLANQTGRATDDIRTRIDNLRREMSAIVSAMHDGAVAVQQGREIVATTGEGMRNISNQVDSLTHRVQDISAILSQQSASTQHVAATITVIAEMATKNASGISSSIKILNRAEPVIAEAFNDLAAKEVLNFTANVAQSDHMIWRKKLAEMLVGLISLNPADLADQHKCRLGKWYDGVQDPALRNDSTFRHLELPHRDVHQSGIECARLYQQGDLNGAIDAAGKAAEASKGVLADLKVLASRN